MYRLKWTIAALATTALFPIGALAQDFGIEAAPAEEEAPPPVYNSYFELGGAYQTEDSFRFGRYTGRSDEGLGLIGAADIISRPAFDGESTEFFRLYGSNLGLDSREALFQYGHQGSFEIDLFYDETPFLQWDDARTPYLGVDGNVLTLPSGWVAATTTGGLTQLNAALHEVNIGTKRSEYGGEVSLDLGGGFSVSAGYSRDEKEGTLTRGFAWGTNGGNPMAVIVPEPVDYRTERFEALIDYVADTVQLQASYTLSLFDNGKESFHVQNPYSGPAGGAPWNAAGAYPASGEMALPPDNSAHEVRLAAGVDVAPNTRLTANGAFSKHYQDQGFLPITSVSGLTVTTPLPRDSLEGEVTTWMANAELFSRLADFMDVRAKYRFIDRHDSTPQDTFVYISGDVEDQAAANTGRARINHPYSFSKHQASAEGIFRVGSRTRINTGYEFEREERTHSEVDHNTEHTVFGKLRTGLGSNVWGSVGYAHGWRTSSTYNDNGPFLEGHTTAYTSTLAGVDLWENHPLMRKFFEFDRDRDKVDGRLSFAATDRVHFGIGGSWVRDDYDESVLGLTESSAIVGTGDVAFQINETINSYAFYTYESRETEQAGWSFRGFAKAAESADSTRRWWANHDDTVHTVGTGLEIQAGDRVTLGVDYAFHYALTAISMSDAGALGLTDLPDIETRVHTVSANATFAVQDNMDLRFGYAFEHYASEDWQVDNIEPTTSARVLALGVDSPDYDVHVFGVSFRYKF